MDEYSLIALQPVISIIWSDEGTNSDTGLKQSASRPRVCQRGNYEIAVHLTFFFPCLRFVEFMQQVVPRSEGSLLQSHDYGLKVSFPALIWPDKCSCLPCTCDNAEPSRLLSSLGWVQYGVMCSSICSVPSAKWLRARLALQGTADTAIHVSLPQSDHRDDAALVLHLLLLSHLLFPLRSHCVFPVMLRILCMSEMRTLHVCVVAYKLGLSGCERWGSLLQFVHSVTSHRRGCDEGQIYTHLGVLAQQLISQSID